MIYGVFVHSLVAGTNVKELIANMKSKECSISHSEAIFTSHLN